MRYKLAHTLLLTVAKTEKGKVITLSESNLGYGAVNEASFREEDMPELLRKLDQLMKEPLKWGSVQTATAQGSVTPPCMVHWYFWLVVGFTPPSRPDRGGVFLTTDQVKAFVQHVSGILDGSLEAIVPVSEVA